MIGPMQRMKIRHRVKDLLKEANTIAKSNVFANRSRNLNDHELPAIVVKTEVEGAEEHSQAPRILKRTLNLTIEAHLEANERIDDRLDYFAGQIEEVMDKDFTLGQQVSNSMLVTSEISIESTGETLHGKIELVYAVVFHTPQTPIAQTDDYKGNIIRLPGQEAS